MAQSTQELYEILVTTTGVAEVQKLVAAMELANKNARAAGVGIDTGLTPAIDRLGVASSRANKAALDMTNRFGDTKTSARNAALAITNVGFQVQDFAVQVSGGTSAMRAFAQQAPQILTAFSIGSPQIAIAVAVIASLIAILPAAIKWMGAFRDINQEVADATKAVTDALAGLNNYIQSARTLYDEYVAAVKSGSPGVIAALEDEARIRALLGQQQLLDLSVLQQKQKFALDDQKKLVAEAQKEVDAAKAYADQMRNASDIDRASPIRDLAAAQAALAAAQDALKRSQLDADLTTAQIDAQNDALEATAALLDDITYGYARTKIAAMDAAAAAAATFTALQGPAGGFTTHQVDLQADATRALAGETKSVVEAQGDAIAHAHALTQGLMDVGAWAQHAADNAWKIAPALKAAHDQLLADIAAMTPLSGPAGGVTTRDVGLSADEAKKAAWLKKLADDAKTQSSGAANAAARKTDELADAVAKARAEIAKLAEISPKQAKEWTDQLNTLLTSGRGAVRGDIIQTTKDAKAALKAIEDAYKEAIKVVNAVTDIMSSSMTDAFDALIDGTKSVKDAFNDMLVDMLKDLAKFLVSRQIQSLANLFATSFGGGITNLFSTPIAPGIGAASASSQAASQSRQIASIYSQAYGEAYGESGGRGGRAAGRASGRGAAPSQTSSGSGSGQFSSSGPAVNTASIRDRDKMVVNINNTVSDDVKVTATQNNQGMGAQLDILIERKVKQLFGSGKLDQSMHRNFGARRVPG